MNKCFYFGSNLKMYKTNRETMKYLHELEKLTKDISRDDIKLFILPSFVSLDGAVKETDPRLIEIGAQTMYWRDRGQFTGEISPVMLKDMGVGLVMAGHSERRHLFQESNFEVGYRVKAAIEHEMTALLCVGETTEEKESLISKEIIREQIKTGLLGIKREEADKVRIAYEPSWAIGVNGKQAEPSYIEAIHETIKETLYELFHEGGQKIPVLYGGSVNRDNAISYGTLNAVDGLFVGRAAWEAEEFNTLIREILA